MKLTVYQLASELNALKEGQAVDLDVFAFDLEHNALAYGNGIDGFLRHLVQNLVGSGYGCFRLTKSHERRVWTFSRIPPSPVQLYHEHPLPGKEQQWRELGWPA